MGKQELRNTATKEIEANPLDAKTGKVTPTPTTDLFSSINKSSIEPTKRIDFNTLDLDYIEDVTPETLPFAENLSASAQTWFEKFRRTTSKGVIKGITGAIDPITTTVGWVMDQAGISAGQTLLDLDDTINESLDKNYAVHETQQDENASLGDKFTRFSTLESIVDSAAEFGLLGMGIGGMTKQLGVMAIRAGASIDAVKGASLVANSAQKVLGRTGRALSQPVSIGKVLGQRVTTNALVSGAAMNLAEGNQMAEETIQELEQLWAPVLYNPEISKEFKDVIQAKIDSAGLDIKKWNTLMAATDIIGFSRIAKYSSKGIAKPGFWNFLWNNVKPLSLTEGAEELYQSIVQSDAEFQNIQNIEDEFQKNFSHEVKGMEFKGRKVSDEDETLLAMVNPARAKEIALQNARTSIDYLMDVATSDQALIEGMSGMLGGGPQWMITGAYPAIANRKANKAAYEEQQQFIGETRKNFQGFVKENLMSEIQTNKMLEELSEEFAGTDKQYIVDAAENYALAKTAENAIRNNREGALEDLLNESKKNINAELKAGTMTQEEAEKYKERIAKTQQFLDEFYNLKTYGNSSELLATALKKVSLKESLQAMKTGKKKAEGLVSKSPSVPPGDVMGALFGKPQGETGKEVVHSNLSNMSDRSKELFEVLDEEVKAKTIEMVTERDISVSVLEKVIANAAKHVIEGQEILEKYATDISKEEAQKKTVIPEESVKELNKEDEVTEDVVEDTIEEIEDLEKAPLKQEPKTTREFNDRIFELEQELAKTNIDFRTLKSSQVQLEVQKQLRKERVHMKALSKISRATNSRTLESIEKSLQDNINNKKLTSNERKNQEELLEVLKDRKSTLQEVKDAAAVKVQTKKERRKKDEQKEIVDDDLPTEDDNELGGITLDEEISTRQQEINKSKAMDIALANLAKSSSVPSMSNQDIKKVKELVQNVADNLPAIERDLGALSFSKSIESEGLQELSNNELNRAQEALKSADALVDGIKAITPGNTIPTFETAVNILKAAGSTDPVVIEGLKNYYDSLELFKGPFKNTTARSVERPNLDAPYIFDEVKDAELKEQPYEHTVASYLQSAVGIGWDGEFIKDYNLIKKGAKIEFKVLTNAEITALEQERGENFVTTGENTETSPLQTLPWESYRKLLNAGKLDKKLYAEDLMRPIQVRMRSNDKYDRSTVGYVHTLQWLEKERKSPIPKETKTKAREDLLTLRFSILNEAGKDFSKTSSGEISGRAENIGLTDSGDFIKGIALRLSSRVYRAEDVYGGDENVIFTVLSNSITEPNDDYLPTTLYKDLVDKGKKVIIPGYLKKNINRYNGAALALIPIENTDYYFATKLATDKLETRTFNMINDITTNLDKINVIRKIKSAFTVKGTHPTPEMLKKMLNSVVNLRDLEKYDNPRTFRFNIKYKQYVPKGRRLKDTPGELTPSEFRSIPEFRDNGELGQKEKLGEVTFGIKLNQDQVNLTYDFIGHKLEDSANPGKHIVVGSYVLKPDQEGERKRIRKKMFEASLEDISNRKDEKRGSAIPHYNIQNYALKNSYKDTPSESGVLSAEGGDNANEWTFKQVDYVKDFVMKKTLTLVERPTVLPGGDRTYFTNTIVTMKFDEKQSKESKRSNEEITSQKTKSISRTTNNILSTAIPELKEDIAQHKKELEADTKLLEMIKAARGKSGTYSLNNLKGTYPEAYIKGFKEFKGKRTYTELQDTAEESIMVETATIELLELDLKKLEASLKSPDGSKNKTVVDKGNAPLAKSTGFSAFLSGEEEAGKPKKSAVENAVQEALRLLDEEAIEELETSIIPEDQSDRAVTVSQQRTETALITPRPLQEKAVSSSEGFETLERNIDKFKFKFIDNKQVAAERFTSVLDIFSMEERGKIADSVQTIMFEKFLGTQKDELDRVDLADKDGNGIAKDTRDQFVLSIQSTRNKSILYKKHLLDKGVKSSDRKYKAVLQYIRGLNLLLEALSEKGSENTAQVNLLLLRGFNKALRNLGYTFRADKQTAQGDDINEAEESDNTVDRMSWINLNQSLFKNPSEGATARIKAKLATLDSYYVDEAGNPFKETNMIGGSEYTTDAYITLLSMFSELPNNNLEDKKWLLTGMTDKISRNPKYYADLYYLKDLKEQMDNEKVLNGYSQRELHLLNTVMNKDELKMVGMGVKRGKNSRLMPNDFNYSSLFKESVTLLNSTLNEITRKRSDEEGDSETVYYLKRSLNPYNIKDNKRLGISATSRFQVEEINYLYENIIELEQQSTGRILTVLRDLNELLNTSNKQLDIKKVNELKDMLARTASDRIFNIFNYIKVPLNKNIANITYEVLKANEEMPVAKFNGEERDDVISSSRALAGFVKNIETYLNPKSTAKEKRLNLETLSLMKMLFNKQAMRVKSTMVRVQTRLVGAFNDKIHLYQEFKKIKNGDGSYLRKKFATDVFAQNSFFRNILMNPEQFPEINDKALFDLPTRAGLLPTFMSRVDKTDDDMQHQLHSLGQYMHSIELGFEKGEKYVYKTTAWDIIQGNEIITHTLKTRLGKFRVPTPSNKDQIFTGNGIDFKAVNVKENGSIEIDDAHVRAYVDMVITPEINRMKQTSSIADNPGYNGGLIYSVPALNNDTVLDAINELDSSVTLNSMFAEAPYKNTSENKSYKELSEVMVAAAKAQLEDTASREFDNMVKSGLIKKIGDGYRFYKDRKNDLNSVNEFKALSTLSDSVPLGSEFDQDYLSSVTPDEYSKFLTTITEHVTAIMIEDRPVLAPLLKKQFNDVGIEAFNKAKGKYKENPTKAVLHKEVTDLFKGMGIGFTKSFKTTEALIEAVKNLTIKNVESIAPGQAKYFTHTGKRILQVVKDKKTSKTTKGAKAVGKDTVIDIAKFKELLINREFGTHVFNTNIHQLVSSDIASSYKKSQVNKDLGLEFGDKGYKYISDLEATYTNHNKRFAKEVSPAVFSDGSKKFIAVVIKEISRESDYYDLGNIDVMDGGSYTDADGRMEQLELEGVLDKSERKDIQDFWNGKRTDEIIQKIGLKKADSWAAIVNKPRYVGSREITVGDNKTVNMPVYGKMGESMVNEAKAGTDPNNGLYKIHKLIQQLKRTTGKQVRVFPQSAIKLGQPTKVIDLENLKVDASGDYVLNTTDDPNGRSYFEMSYEDFGRQQRTDYKRGKKLKPSGQVENLIWNAVKSGKISITDPDGKKVDVRKYWEDVLGKIYSMQIDQVENMFLSEKTAEIALLLDAEAVYSNPFRTEEDSKAELDRLREAFVSDKTIKAVLEAALERLSDDDFSKVNPNITEWLELNSNGTFKYDITESPYIEKYSDILRKAIEKKTVALTREGRQLPLESDYGYDVRTMGMQEGQRDIVLLNDFVQSGELDMKNGRLKPQLVTKVGSTPSGAQILIPFDFTALVYDEKKGKYVKRKIRA